MGLKQRPHAWFARFTFLLAIFDLLSCITHPTIITKKIDGGITILAVYIDDIIVIKSDEVDI